VSDRQTASMLAAMFERGEVAGEVSEPAFLQAMLDVEVALARALARVGLAPATAAEELAAAADATAFDLDRLSRSMADKGTPVPGLVAALRERVSDTAAIHVHRGATSQDIVDTAMMLVARRALRPILADLAGAADACAEIAERHRATLAAGRTLLQQALPLTFGLKAATWLVALDDAAAELAVIRDRGLAVQLGGAVGTLAAWGERGLEVVADVAAALELAEPELPWHTIRLRPVRLACALAAALGVMAKIAHDVVLLAQTEVGEAAERGGDGRGGSSTLPHKRNPVDSVAVIACAQRGPGLAATMISAMVQEHERAAGAWQAEWPTLLELLGLTGSAARSLRELLAGLTVDPNRMSTNLDITRGLLMSESVVMAVSDSIPRPRAQALVEAASLRAVDERRPLREVLLEVPEIADSLGQSRLDEALDPRGYLGATDALIDRALRAHRGGA
jgi:3-carboxy-cis,cis-muconate cycloisomerase